MMMSIVLFVLIWVFAGIDTALQVAKWVAIAVLLFFLIGMVVHH